MPHLHSGRLEVVVVPKQDLLESSAVVEGGVTQLCLDGLPHKPHDHRQLIRVLLHTSVGGERVAGYEGGRAVVFNKLG